MKPDAVVVDTSLWVEFFRGSTPLSSAVERLILEEQAVTTGLILAELLQGVKKESEAQKIIEVFDGLPTAEITTPIWRSAGRTGAALRRKGVTLPLSDLAIAALAVEHGLLVFTLDKHFDQIQDIRFYRPET